MDLFGDYTLRLVAVGSAVLGATSGALGSFAYLRRQSLLGDAVSHAALPGIVLAFMLTGSKIPLVLMLGAGLAGWLGTLVVRLVVNRSRVPYDSALGIVLAVFFGVGLVLLTMIQKRSDAAQAGLESFLFGQAASLLKRDVVAMAVLGAIVLALVLLLWKEFKLLSFDPDFAASLGLPVRRLDGLLRVTSSTYLDDLVAFYRACRGSFVWVEDPSTSPAAFNMMLRTGPLDIPRVEANLREYRISAMEQGPDEYFLDVEAN